MRKPADILGAFGRATCREMSRPGGRASGSGSAIGPAGPIEKTPENDRNVFQDRSSGEAVQLAEDAFLGLEDEMSTTLAEGTATAARILNEGYRTGAWHGPDLKSALGGVASEEAFWRPSAGRHTIAEIARRTDSVDQRAAGGSLNRPANGGERPRSSPSPDMPSGDFSCVPFVPLQTGNEQPPELPRRIFDQASRRRRDQDGTKHHRRIQYCQVR
jgi:hypothetical protein